LNERLEVTEGTREILSVEIVTGLVAKLRLVRAAKAV
jgi:hypothetical protein